MATIPLPLFHSYYNCHGQVLYSFLIMSGFLCHVKYFRPCFFAFTFPDIDHFADSNSFVLWVKYLRCFLYADAVYFLGRVFEAISLLIFLLMIILMAKGFTITRGKISTTGSIKIAVFMVLYTVTYIILFIYEAYVSNRV